MIKEQPFVGRTEEVATFHKLLQSAQSELVAVIGRRRVGKTYLIKNAYKNAIDFHFTGTKQLDVASTLQEFGEKITIASKGKLGIRIPSNWMEAFKLLKQYIESLNIKRKRIIFLDELPWLDAHKSGFLPAFEYFWNDWAVDQNIILVVCGSSTSWMINNIMNNTGGLHNRITQYINLQPFTLAETKALFVAKKMNIPIYEIAQLYMALGGIPYYLNEVKGDQSAIQNIDQLLFSQKSTLKYEFQNLYRALFNNYENYELIIKALAKKQKGLTRQEIVSATKLSNGGGLTRMLTELEQSSFIKTYVPFAKSKKETLYRLVDEYSIFYFQFSPDNNTAGSFLQLSNSSKYKSWAGFAFESLCFKHIVQIKKAMGIQSVHTVENSFYHKGEGDGFQIDLLIDRADNVINICEAKFYGTTYELNRKEAEALRYKVEQFKNRTGTKKYVVPTLLTTFDLKHNEHSLGLVKQVVLLEDLF